ncbi:MAG: hypothetical protein CEE40_09820 [Chloroflexi bacterium B3_Chlor]|nr:MAG: hypothetical protein CEE40_09820 [Chloroflexi bacterium B3_Chlor]
MKTWSKILIVLILIALPVVGRGVWFHRGWYQPPLIREIDEDQIEVLPPEYRSIAEEVEESVGRVVVDLAHENNLEVDDLTPLRDRLIARGAAVETFDGFSASLESQLRGAIALVVVAPTSEYAGYEVEAIVDFVEDGGRVLLAADPTRPVPSEEEEGSLDLGETLFPASAVPAINSLANPLGVVYFDDHLYNLVDNEGNYRNVKLTSLSDEHPLTEGLDTVVFFAAHSLRSEGLSLMSGDENTFSSLRTGETALTVAALAADERALALGDVTALTAPYHTVADNDQLLSNIADWLASAERVWDLNDFPYLFQRSVDLVQIAGDFLDPRLIARTGALEEVLAQADLTLSVRDTADRDNDTIFVGTFEDVELVEEYLDEGGVTITLVEEEGEEGAAATEEAEEEEEEPRDTVEVEELGSIPMEGTTLFVVDRSADRVVVIALAEDGDSAMAALDRLAFGDFSGCVESDDVTVCSTGEVQEGLGLDTEREEPEEREEAPEEGEGEAELPRIGSRLESDAALAAGVPWLTELAEEDYEITSQAGETYTYTITLDRSRDVVWMYGWCATTKELLGENWDSITLAFRMDGEEVPLGTFATLETDIEDQECRLYYVLVTDWPPGEHVLITEVTFETELDDGTDIYPAGTHFYEHIVTVGG